MSPFINYRLLICRTRNLCRLSVCRCHLPFPNNLPISDSSEYHWNDVVAHVEERVPSNKLVPNYRFRNILIFFSVFRTTRVHNKCQPTNRPFTIQTSMITIQSVLCTTLEYLEIGDLELFWWFHILKSHLSYDVILTLLNRKSRLVHTGSPPQRGEPLQFPT